MAPREGREREQVGLGIGEHDGDLRVGPAEHRGDLAELFLDVLAVGLGEDRADARGHHLLRALRHDREAVAYEMDPASLPAGALEHRLNGLLEPGVRVRPDELHPAQAADLQRAEEAGPEALVLAVTDVDAEHFPAPVGGHPDGDDQGLGQDPVPDPGLAVGGVEGHIREVLRGQGSVAKLGYFRVEARKDPGHFGLGDAGISAERCDEVVDLPSGDAVHVGLHHHREQGLLDPTAPLQQGREERPHTQLPDLQPEVPGRGRQPAGTGAVAKGGAVVGALEWGSADERGRFRIDQRLVESFGRVPDSVGDIGEFQLAKEVEQASLVLSHRVVSFVRSSVGSH